MPLDAGAVRGAALRVLHELDAENWPWIAVETPPDTPEWAAIRDRLAPSGRTVEYASAETCEERS